MAEVSRRTVVVVAGGAVSLAALTLSRSRGRPGGPSAGPVRTSFGSVAVLGSSRTGTASNGTYAGHGAAGRTARRMAGRPAGRTTVAAGHETPPADLPVASAVHGAWTAAVVVDLEVHNRLRRPVALSPGQFRMRVDRRGPTVSLYSSDHDATPLEPGATRTLRISYLAPPPDQPLSLEFEDTGVRRAVDLGPVGRTSAEEAWS